MREKPFPKLLLILLPLLFMLVSAGKPWLVMDLKALEKNMKLIPGGELVTGEAGQDSIDCPPSYWHQYSVPRCIKRSKVDNFYLNRYEVTNLEYHVFLNELKASGDEKSYLIALPDTQLHKFTYNEPYVQYYHRHPAYANYPAVNISYEGAQLFCKWLTSKYNSWPRRSFNKVNFRLPTEVEWMHASRGDQKYLYYPFTGLNLRDEKGKWKANFFPINQNAIYTRDSLVYNPLTGKYDTKKFYELTPIRELTGFSGFSSMEVNSYGPFNSGLYNMAGNVSEMVAEKGISKGGGWESTGYFLEAKARESYNDSISPASPCRGFRVAMDVVEK